VSRFVSPTTFHALGYALVASGSLREVFERIVRYHQVVSDALTLTLDGDGERYRFRMLQPAGSPAPAFEAIDAFAAIYVRTCRNRLGRDYAPLAVYLRRPEPVDPQPWHTVFRAPVFFGAEEDRLEFAAQHFDIHLVDANPELADHNETVLKRTLAQLQPLTWERKVRRVIEAQLPDGEPSAERVAQALHLSLRSLQRHLADEGCRFDALLNECRENLALLHLRDPQCSLAEISHLLGFADSSSFSRAFKKWTGVTPGAYRAQERERCVAWPHPIAGKKRSNSRKMNFESGPTQRRIPQGQPRAVTFDDVLDHRQPDPLPRMLAVQPLTPLQNPRPLVRRYARPIIFNT